VIDGRIKARRPDRHHCAAPKTGQPVQTDREDKDQQDADQEDRQRNPDQAHRHEQPGKPRVAVNARINAHRDADRDRQDRRRERQLHRGGKPLLDQLRHRLREAKADPEFAMQHGPKIACELDEKRLVQTELVDQCLALCLCVILAEDDRHRIADVVEQRERNQPDHQKDRDGLEQPSRDESKHRR